MHTRRLITKQNASTRHSTDLIVKIVTYNVLSSRLSDKDWFINNDVQYLNPKKRFVHTLRKLDSIRDTLPEKNGYTLLTKGMVHPTDNLSDEGHSHRYPTSTICGLNSAYVLKKKKEPDFTNYADPNNNSFMGTIDYVFLSKPEHHSKKQTWYVESVKSLPTRQKGIKNGTLPNQFEPSDHLLLWATLKLI